MIKNIIFDFGNVLFDLDLGRIERGFRQLIGAENWERFRAQLLENQIFELYETGGISTEEFVAAIRHAALPTEVSAAEICAIWNSIFLDFPRHRLEMLLRLRERYSVFMLSNINELHAEWIEKYLLHEHGISDFESRFFDAVYYSHLIRLRKPTRESFEYVLSDAELVAEECVFFDDLAENVAAAERLGIRGVVHPVGSEIEKSVADFIDRHEAASTTS